MIEHLTVGYKNVIFNQVPHSPCSLFLVRQTADTAYHNTLHTRMIRKGGGSWGGDPTKGGSNIIKIISIIVNQSSSIMILIQYLYA